MALSTKGRAAALAALVLAAQGVACDRAESDRNAAATPSGAAVPRDSREPAAPGPAAAKPGCIVPLSATPPPKASPAEDCPVDPDGPPVMPRGTVTFSDAPGAPRIEVEVARTTAHRTHGLMYRRSLPEDAGMIFSWHDEALRSFWMHNTCLPLDMLFIAKDGTIVGVLEQVPTMNDEPRGVPCKAAHVLEVNAGWVRAHGVEPGQRVAIET